MNFWGLSDKGSVRPENQDVYAVKIISDSIAVCVVCDGMGGAAAGNIASATALDSFMCFVERELTAQRKKRRAEIINAAIAYANGIVHALSERKPEYAGMGTTMVGAIIDKRHAMIFNIGDSRAYHITPMGIRCITKDHSVVEDMIQLGNITREEARRHPSKNLITRAVGTEQEVDCDIFELDINEGEYLLLCSDGLTAVVTDQEILYEILHGGDMEECCRRLLDIAISRGAPDNVTSVIFAQ